MFHDIAKQRGRALWMGRVRATTVWWLSNFALLVRPMIDIRIWYVVVVVVSGGKQSRATLAVATATVTARIRCSMIIPMRRFYVDAASKFFVIRSMAVVALKWRHVVVDRWTLGRRRRGAPRRRQQ
jgi:hypothetical protein